jgi:hypothetical protein
VTVVLRLISFPFGFQIRDSELQLIVVEANKIVSSSAHEITFVFAFDFLYDDSEG